MKRGVIREIRYQCGHSGLIRVPRGTPASDVLRCGALDCAACRYLQDLATGHEGRHGLKRTVVYHISDGTRATVELSNAEAVELQTALCQGQGFSVNFLDEDGFRHYVPHHAITQVVFDERDLNANRGGKR